MEEKEYCYIGRIVKTHGLKGEITLRFDNDEISSISNLKYFLLDINHKIIPFFIDSIIFHAHRAFVLFQDINTLEAATRLVDKEVYLPIELLPDHVKKDFYLREIIGYQVIDEKEGEIGLISDILEYPTQSLIQIIKDGKEILIPVHDDIIKKVNDKAKKILIKAPEGLIDMYLGK